MVAGVQWDRLQTRFENPQKIHCSCKNEVSTGSKHASAICTEDFEEQFDHNLNAITTLSQQIRSVYDNVKVL